MDDFDYHKLLKKVESELPENISNSERFQIENVRGHLEGNKTIISNFKKIVKDLRREPEHALKFILKEIAAPGKFDGDRLIIGTKVAASLINKKVRQYAGQYVLCPDCGKPDTLLVSRDSGTHIKCTACGAEHQIKTL